MLTSSVDMSRFVGQEGALLVVSGPSGSGKSTLVRQLLALNEFPIVFSVSATSRDPRVGEVDGRDYRFLSRTEFERMASEDAFLEYAEVHGNLYGTLRRDVEKTLAQGQWVLLEIDVEGHRQVKRAMPQATSFFIRAPSIEDYAERLEQRGTDSDAVMAQRVANARAELSHARDYDFQIVNETVEQALRCFQALLWGLHILRGKTHAG